MRDASIAVLREIGVDTGGSNVQFAIKPDDGRMVVIEMNPRVSRSSALASKATGFPIAKVAAKLAVGYTLDELANDITGGATPASFEPTIDYVVTKIPRFAFEKFPQADDRLTTQMKSVGEVMAIGRTFQESFQKALRGLEIGVDGLEREDHRPRDASTRELGDARPGAHLVRRRCVPRRLDARRGPPAHAHRSLVPRADRGHRAPRAGARRARARQRSARDELRDAQAQRASPTGGSRSSSARPSDAVRARRHALGRPAGVQARRHLRGRVRDATPPTCTRPTRRSARRSPTDRKKIMVLGGGPNRIGQGIEFDYCCVHAALALREDGFETIMVNCNPETVSTDYDTSDRLYFEPLTLEDVLEIVDTSRSRSGVIVQFGGQTPLKLARDLEANGVPIIGTTPDMIDVAEDRERFQKLLHELELKQPPNRTARDREPRRSRSREEIGYPLVVRPSYVLGGRAMEIVHEQARPRALHARGGEGLERFAGAARPVPERRDRSRRRRGLRRQAAW